ncbi:MAG: squalene/phytoene synthase family protein, partial [Pseudorhodoplanes sp.]
YETIEDLHGYAARVAGCVGVMMTLVMGRREPAVLARACDLGMAMQLTNIARDVGEDARDGRLYLPQQWLREAGVDPEALLAGPRFSENLGGVVQRLLDHADDLYARATHAISALPADCRPAIHAARVLYAEIGRELERNGLDSVSKRAVVPASRKLAVLLRTCTDSLARPQLATMPVSAPAAFLIDAVSVLPHAIPERIRPMPWHRVRDRAIWVIDLFERLERRAQMERAS